MENEMVEVVLITNAGEGFGRTVALTFAELNYDVVCADKDVELAAKTAAEIEELGGNAIPIQADMSSSKDARLAFDKVFEIFGSLNGVIHLATHESNAALRDLTETEFAELINEDVKSTFLVLKNSAKLLDRAWLVLIGPPKSANLPHMFGMRGAITRMAAAFESRYEDLRVNVIIPSRSASDPEHDAHLADTVSYLASPYAEGVSGQRLNIDLPKPPNIEEKLLPEVRAALNENFLGDEFNDYEDEIFLEEELDVSFDELEEKLDNDLELDFEELSNV
ncbi:MAG TPA: SDR family NAD(P)-dependent oxidoreductase [Trueperaceae bacterium]|nr:SDR family NAD(P)-dependent oxidoreductase [Trueperaceae bacterium]